MAYLMFFFLFFLLHTKILKKVQFLYWKIAPDETNIFIKNAYLTLLARVPRYLRLKKCPAVARPEISRAEWLFKLFFTVKSMWSDIHWDDLVLADKSLFLFWLCMDSPP